MTKKHTDRNIQGCRVQRRLFLRGTAALLSTPMLSPAIAQDKGQVIVASWGGTFQDSLREAILKPFERATGIKVVEAVGPQLSKLRAMIGSKNPEWDVAEVLPGNFEQLNSEGMLEPLDYNSMDRSVFADLPKSLVQPTGVGTYVYSTVLAFNTKKYSQATAPKSWADVWDTKKFPGERILNSGASGIPPIELALLADGVSPDKLYPLDFKRAYAALTRIKPNVVKWATTSAMGPEALISGDAVIGSAPHGRIQLAKEQGAPVDYVWNQSLSENSWWAVLKGAKNRANAQKFIEFASRPESQAALAKLFIVGPVNRKAFDLIPPERARLLPTYPDHAKMSVPINRAWWSQKDASGRTNTETNLALWNAWILQS